MLLTFLISCKKGASNSRYLRRGLCWELETLPAWLSPAAAWREAAHTGHVVPRGAVAQRAYQCQTRVVIAHTILGRGGLKAVAGGSPQTIQLSPPLELCFVATTVQQVAFAGHSHGHPLWDSHR